MPLPSNVVVVDCAQRTPEWLAARLGRVTSSKVDLLFTQGRKKGEESVQRRDYRIQLVCEQLTGQPSTAIDEWKGPWVERGKQLEAEARASYEAVTASVVWTPGFLSHGTHAMGTSLDGVVGDFARVVEFKVPKPATHLAYLRKPDEIPPEYQNQVCMHFLISGVEVVDFVSYCPLMPAPIQVFMRRIARPAAETLKAFEMQVLAFLSELSAERREIAAMVAAKEREAA